MLKAYERTEEVMAEPITWGEYCKETLGKHSLNGDPDEEGYKVFRNFNSEYPFRTWESKTNFDKDFNETRTQCTKLANS